MPEITRSPLPAGTIISYCDEEATVVEDDGGGRITVMCDGSRQRWYWNFEGEECKVVKLPCEVPREIREIGQAILDSGKHRFPNECKCGRPTNGADSCGVCGGRKKCTDPDNKDCHANNNGLCMNGFVCGSSPIPEKA